MVAAMIGGAAKVGTGGRFENLLFDLPQRVLQSLFAKLGRRSFGPLQSKMDSLLLRYLETLSGPDAYWRLL